MLFISIIILIICKALINDKLSEDFYHRISAIILLISGLLAYRFLNLESLTGIYSGLFSLSIRMRNVADFFNYINNITFNFNFDVPFVSELLHANSEFNDFFLSVF